MTAYETEVAADSPKGWWKLGDASGTTAVDSSGNSHDGTYGSGITLAENYGVNRTDDCVRSHQTSNDYMQVADHADFKPTTAISVEAWIYRDAAVTSGNQRIVQKATDDNGLRIYCTSTSINGRLRINGTNRDVSYTVNLADDVWHHVVLTWVDGGTVKLWLDKVKVAESSSYSGPLDTNTHALEWCRKASGDGTGDHFAGWVDEAAFYSTELSSTRIAAHYDNASFAAADPRTTQAWVEVVMADTTPEVRVSQTWVEVVCERDYAYWDMGIADDSTMMTD